MLCSHVSEWLRTKVQNHTTARFQEVTFKEHVEAVRNHCLKGKNIVKQLPLFIFYSHFFLNIICFVFFVPPYFPFVLCMFFLFFPFSEVCLCLLSSVFLSQSDIIDLERKITMDFYNVFFCSSFRLILSKCVSCCECILYCIVHMHCLDFVHVCLNVDIGEF